MSNPFQNTEAWEPNVTLPEGNYVVKIDSAENGTSSGSYPQIELRLMNQRGAIRDWVVITENSIGKVVALAQAAGVALPEDDDIADPATFRLSDAWIFRLVGKQVGIVVRNEQKRGGDVGEMIPRVQGYVAPARVGDYGSDVTPQGAGNSFAAAKPAKPAPDLPF